MLWGPLPDSGQVSREAARRSAILRAIEERDVGRRRRTIPTPYLWVVRRRRLRID